MEKDKHDTIATLSSGPVQRMLRDLENSDIHRLILQHQEIFGLPAADIAAQIAVRRKAREKLPLYYHTPGAVFPPAENFEQSSSQATATFRASIVQQSGHPGSCVDLSGGFGVDTFFLSQVVEAVHCVEPDARLLQLAQYNHELLGARNITYHNTTAAEFLKASSTRFDWLYADPSRRTEAKKRVVVLEDTVPNIVDLLPIIRERSERLLVKASPLLDIRAGINRLTGVARVWVVAVANECKEVLFLHREPQEQNPFIEAVNLSPTGTVLSRFVFSMEEEATAHAPLAPPQTYLYEPNAAILKAGAFKTVAGRYQLHKVHANTHLYTGSDVVEDFPGRSFEIVGFMKSTRGDAKKHFPDGRANVMTRNYPLTPEQLKHKLDLQDGGDQYLIAFSDARQKYLAVARRLKRVD